MNRTRKLALVLGAAAVLATPVVPSFGAPGDARRSPFVLGGPGFGVFTPAVADPKLAAIYARNGQVQRGFRFTPVVANRSRAVTVAVRANRTVAPQPADRTIAARVAPAAAANIGVNPVAYNLGASVGWKHFALQGAVTRFDTGPVPGGREAAKVAAGYSTHKWSTRVQLEAERPVGPTPRDIAGSERLALDVAGSFRLTRNLDVTAGIRYQSDRDRLFRVTDDRRDSQAVYVGTAFRF